MWNRESEGGRVRIKDWKEIQNINLKAGREYISDSIDDFRGGGGGGGGAQYK
jgi:hypothetical protein